MGLFNHLFGGKKRIAEELKLDEKKRLVLWKKHIQNYPKKEELSRYFSFRDIDNALKDINALDNVMRQIESLILQELVNIKDEEKTDKEILADLGRLTSEQSKNETNGLNVTIEDEYYKQKALLKLFKKIHEVLKLELHAINAIKKHPENMRELLLYLFRLIFHQEAYLYHIYLKKSSDRSLDEEINKITRAILLEQEFKKEVQSAEDRFVRSVVEIMGVEGSEETKHHYRKLAESIYFRLAEMAGAPIKIGDITKGIERLERLMRNDGVMFEIIKKERPKYSNEKILWIIKAFRKAYSEGHFLELESEFAT